MLSGCFLVPNTHTGLWAGRMLGSVRGVSNTHTGLGCGRMLGGVRGVPNTDTGLGWVLGTPLTLPNAGLGCETAPVTPLFLYLFLV